LAATARNQLKWLATSLVARLLDLPTMSPRRSFDRPFGGAVAAAALATATLATAASCTDEPDAPDGSSVISHVTRIEIPIASNRNLDLLFVIDNSPRMASQRTKLLDNYRRFMAVLETYNGGLPDVHIGVVTTDLGTRAPGELGPGRSVGTGPGSCSADGDRGELRRAPAVDGNFISDILRPNGTRERSYTGSLTDAFTQLADVGSAGCAYARPLEAARRALVDNPANAGFLREDAYLMIVMLTNDEDCSFGSSLFADDTLDRSRCTTEAASLVPVAEYIQSLKSLKPDSFRMLVSGGFAPSGAPACADVRPSVRLDALVTGFPERSQVVSICEQDLSELVRVPVFLVAAYGAACLDTLPLDVDPVTDGLQIDSASWFRYRDGDELVDELFPFCRADTPGMCWSFVPDPLNCPNGTGQALDVRNARRFIEATLMIEYVSR
jgi:hypothetical protein